MSELTEVEMVAKIVRFGFDQPPSMLERAELIAIRAVHVAVKSAQLLALMTEAEQ